MCGVDVNATNNDSWTTQDVATNQICAPAKFVDAFNRLVANTDEDAWESPVFSATVTNDLESLRSFEQQICYEVEALA